MQRSKVLETCRTKRDKIFKRKKYLWKTKDDSSWTQSCKIKMGLLDDNNNVVKFKARFVAKVFSQGYGKDYLETFSPVALLQSIRTLAAISAAKNLKIHHMDVETAFLNAKLNKIGEDSDVLLELPPGCESLEMGNIVKVFRALNGFKQSPREWNRVLHINHGFTQLILAYILVEILYLLLFLLMIYSYAVKMIPN
jgi:hypothetical protein